MRDKLDSIDRRILAELQLDGRLSIVELANRIHLTKTPCTERVRRLERTGIIKGYHADLDAEALGRGFSLVVQVSLLQTSNNSLEEFSTAVKRIPEISACYMLAGQFDFLLIVKTSDIAHYRSVLGNQIGKLPGVSQTNSFVVMELVKDEKRIPI